MCPQNVASLLPPQWKGDVRSSRIGALLHALVAERYVALGPDISTAFLSLPVAAEGGLRESTPHSTGA